MHYYPFPLALIPCFLLICVKSGHGMNKMPPPEVKGYPGFSRQCTIGGDKDCQLKIASTSSTLHFSCKDATAENGGKFCTCLTGSLPQDELMWPLEWEPKEGKCLVGKGAPCGEDKGLSTNCKDPLQCLDGRCRKTEELHTAEINGFCNDDLDCKKGLSCKDSVTQTFVKIKRCYQQ